jgi:hypothetical protein
MPNDLFRLFPIEKTKILVVLFLSFLIRHGKGGTQV